MALYPSKKAQKFSNHEISIYLSSLEGVCEFDPSCVGCFVVGDLLYKYSKELLNKWSN